MLQCKRGLYNKSRNETKSFPIRPPFSRDEKKEIALPEQWIKGKVIQFPTWNPFLMLEI